MEKLKKKIDILILLDKASLNYSSDPRVFRTAYYLCEKGYKIAIIGFQSENKEIKLDDNLTIYNIIPKEITSFRSIFSLRQKISKSILNQFSFNYIIANDHTMLSMGKIIKSLTNNVKLFYDSHEFFQDYQLEFFENEGWLIKLKSIIWRWIEKKIELSDVKHVDEIIASNQSIATLFEYIFKPQNRVNVVRNIPSYNPSITINDLVNYDKNIYELLEQNKNFTNLIYFGNYMRKLNGMEMLLTALKDLPENFKLIILGTDKSNGFFERMIKSMDIENKIIKINRIPHHFMPLVAQYAKISIVPTLHSNYLQCYFSLPNKFLESIKSKLPIISIDLPEQKQIIEIFNNGLLINEEKDHIIESIKNGCHHIINNYDEYKKNAEICDAHINAIVDLEKLASKFK